MAGSNRFVQNEVLLVKVRKQDIQNNVRCVDGV